MARLMRASALLVVTLMALGLLLSACSKPKGGDEAAAKMGVTDEAKAKMMNIGKTMAEKAGKGQ